MDINNFKYLLDKFHSGLTDENENETLRQIFESGRTEEYNQYSQEKWGNVMDSLSDEKKTSMKQDILRRIFSLEDYKNTKKISRLRKVAGRLFIAASIGFAVVGGFYLSRYVEKEQSFEVTANCGQKSFLTLPDGTIVKLNSASTVTYTSDYNKSNRTVQLSGEAYFEVAKNDKLPFIVEAGDCMVKALGTKFNVRNYSSETETVTTLVEGKVLTSVKGTSKILLPQQMLIFNRITNTLAQRAASPDHIVPWLDNEILFDNNDLKEIASTLERMYNVKIIFEDPFIAKYSYTGLIRNNSLTNVLDLISGTSPVKYEISGNIIKFSKKP